MTSTQYTPFKAFGELMAAAWHGIPLKEAVTIKTAAESVSCTDRPHSMDRMMCKLASDMYLLAGKPAAPERMMFVKMAASEKWNPLLQPIVDTVYEVAGDEWLGRLAAHKEQLNKAAGLGAITANMARMGLGVAPEIAKMMPMLAVAGGAGAGGLWWLANRHAEEDDSDTAALKAKVDYYKSITEEITDELNRKGIVTNPSEDPEQRESTMAALKDTQLYRR